ncbi:MAG TPA: polysaccharide deacetylase family protein [Candidatus Saccharimonadia bacterium]|nr:polysaccharide deacetylase family protein [Candidatus Saccharimonadia bacterium]
MRDTRPEAGDAMREKVSRRIAVTIDDLPWAGLGIRSANAPAHMASHHPRLVAALQAAKAPVVGFVNEGKLEGENGLVPERVDMLHDWLDAGAELGNHTHAHLDLHAVGLPRYQQDILDGERVTRELLQERGAAPRWFRHPFLRAGRTAEDKSALAEFLAKHGYRVAPVTVDNSEWIWARAYRSVLEGDAARDAREATLARLRADYVPYMIAKLAYFEAQSRELLGYELPQVLLLHANELNAETYGALVTAIRARGYRFVTLEEALRNPAYARVDGYHGAYGPSWLHRWAIAEERPKEFFAGEPATPEWVMTLAGVESE